MKLTIGGARGTSAVTDADFFGYGGDTSSFLIESVSGNQILIDLGTGLRTLTSATAPCSVKRIVLMTHYHLDHLNGFPVLPHIYNPQWNATIMGPPSEGKPVQEVFADLMSHPFWPLQIGMLAADIQFLPLPAPRSTTPMPFGDLLISWCPVHHPGNCTAYRIDEPATSSALVLATDIEWGLSTPEEKAEIINLCSSPYPAKLLIFDGHFTPANIAAHSGWGHSTWEEGIELTNLSKVGQLLITHHDPALNDTALIKLEATLRENHPNASLARQEQEITLP